jgi:dTDP-4-amino-4,6-dideoxygalactose transaminase
MSIRELEQIPFLDLVTPHVELRSELLDVFEDALCTAGFVGGPLVENFERQFAAFCETRHCVGVASGTDAVRFALMAAGVKSGDVVLTVPNTFIATTEAISQAGAIPEFVDVDPRTYCMDSVRLSEFLDRCSTDSRTGKRISRKHGRQITAVVPVHLYGQCADMDAVLDAAAQYDLAVIEDACQAHGAQYFSARHNRWFAAGSMGIAAAFSFYPGKNLGACGEAGAVTTNSEPIAKTIRMLRDHGQAKKYYHSMEGYNGRLDAIQAGILSAKLRHLPEWNARRREAASHYDRALSETESIVAPFTPDSSRHVYHLYVVQVPDRDGLQKHLAAVQIGTGIHYPVPLHLQDAYSSLGYHVGDFPVSETVSARILSLPMYPQLTPVRVRRIADQIAEFFSFATANPIPSRATSRTAFHA